MRITNEVWSNVDRLVDRNVYLDGVDGVDGLHRVHRNSKNDIWYGVWDNVWSNIEKEIWKVTFAIKGEAGL